MLLITGATGFIGKNLIPEITKQKAVRILVRRTSNLDFIRGKGALEIAYADLEKGEGIDDALKGVDIVIHCAARTMGRNFLQYYRTNTEGTANLLKALTKRNIKGIMYLSSHAACGPGSEKNACKEMVRPRPISFYGMTKKLAEEIIRKSGVPYTILRPVSVYGPYDMDILKYIRLLNQGICPIVGFREKYLNLIYVRDLVDLIIKIVDAEKFDSQTYFVNDGNCYSFTEILSEIQKNLQKRNIKIYVPETLALFIGLMNDVFLPEQKMIIGRDRMKDLAAAFWLCSNEKFVNEFKFTPQYSLAKGMEETIVWYKKAGFLK